MSPQDLLQHAAALMTPVLRFECTTEQVLAQYFRQHTKIGARERALLSDAVYRVVRLKTLLLAQAQTAPRGIGSQERKLALLGVNKHLDYFSACLSTAERDWLDKVQQEAAVELDAADEVLPAAQRHNLPDWLATRLQAELGENFWPFSLACPFRTKRRSTQFAYSCPPAPRQRPQTLYKLTCSSLLDLPGCFRALSIKCN